MKSISKRSSKINRSNELPTSKGFSIASGSETGIGCSSLCPGAESPLVSVVPESFGAFGTYQVDSYQREGQSPVLLGDHRKRDFLPEPKQTLFDATTTPRMSPTKSALTPSPYGHGLSNGHTVRWNRAQAQKESKLLKTPHLIASMGGDLLEIKGRKLDCSEQKVHRSQSLRGKVDGFSRKSQQRLRRRVSEADKEQCGVPFFVTLTYPGIFPADRCEWMRHLNNLDRRIRSRFSEFVFFVWKLEPQKRGAPHFHLVLCIEGEKSDDSFLPILREFIAEAWFEVVGTGKPEHLMAGTQVQQVKSWEGVKHYTSKYISKTFDGDEVPDWWQPGRYWGVRGLIPTHKVLVKLDLTQFYQIRRLANRFLRSVTRGSGFRPKIWAPDSGVVVHWSENTAIKVLAWLDSVGYTLPDDRPILPKDNIRNDPLR